MDDIVPMSQTPNVSKPLEEDELIGQVAGLSMRAILGACAALEALTDSIQKGMVSIKDSAVADYAELVGKVQDQENISWIEFIELLHQRNAKARQNDPTESTEDNETAVKAVERVFEQEQLHLVARHAFELEDLVDERWGEMSESRHSPSGSKKRRRRTAEHATPPASARASCRHSVKMTPKLASCAKRFAEELSTMRRIDSKRQSSFVLLSAEPSRGSSFRLSSVLGSAPQRPPPPPTVTAPRYTFGEEWQEAQSCKSSSERQDSGESECCSEDTENCSDEEDSVRVSVEGPLSDHAVPDEETAEACGLMEREDIAEEMIGHPPLPEHPEVAGVLAEDEEAMTDGDYSAEGEPQGDASENEEDELSETSSCEDTEQASRAATSPVRASTKSPVSSYLPGVGALLKTPLVRIQEKLGAFGRSKPASADLTDRQLKPDVRRVSTADVTKADEAESDASSSTLFKGTAEQISQRNALRSFHRFLKPLGPKSPLNSLDVLCQDPDFENRTSHEQVVWARGDGWQREVQRQSRWNPYSLFGYGVKAAQFTDVFQTPDFRRATSNIPDKTDGRKSRMNRWEVDKVASAFNPSEGMTQQQLESMVKLLNKTEDISDLAYGEMWAPCSADCRHDTRKQQPWHREDRIM
eukprot:Protomagalhaensia_sp_Gyna_25__2691@NODE_253_length_4172_cov_32_949431_g195_i0_p1_GENE_NODE_253_length_4172_cov_32_949431_g195_i0NODE_253_length_4172_cov_32_949431_g195_i0_p1_ORF_typecomplete_len641_score138_15INCENP_ARKbind/PF03941_15/0_0091_NODE_253_length_4172_cov_32_949431_g195_i022274149